MASDRTRERVRQFVSEYDGKMLQEKLVALLEAFEREMRLDEQQNHNMVTAAAWRERIAELAAQPTPEVKK